MGDEEAQVRRQIEILEEEVAWYRGRVSDATRGALERRAELDALRTELLSVLGKTVGTESSSSALDLAQELARALMDAQRRVEEVTSVPEDALILAATRQVEEAVATRQE